MIPTLNPLERINELEKEVKGLTRLIREAKAREKVMAARLMLIAKDQKQTEKAVKELALIARKTDAKVSQVHSQVQSKK